MEATMEIRARRFVMICLLQSAGDLETVKQHPIRGQSISVFTRAGASPVYRIVIGNRADLSEIMFALLDAGQYSRLGQC